MRFSALKYSTAVPVIFLSALKYHVFPEKWTSFYRPLWLLSSVLNSLYSFYWDVTRDWDLRYIRSLCFHNIDQCWANHFIFYAGQVAWTIYFSACYIHWYWPLIFLSTSENHSWHLGRGIYNNMVTVRSLVHPRLILLYDLNVSLLTVASLGFSSLANHISCRTCCMDKNGYE